MHSSRSVSKSEGSVTVTSMKMTSSASGRSLSAIDLADLPWYSARSRASGSFAMRRMSAAAQSRTNSWAGRVQLDIVDPQLERPGSRETSEMPMMPAMKQAAIFTPSGRS